MIMTFLLRYHTRTMIDSSYHRIAERFPLTAFLSALRFRRTYLIKQASALLERLRKVGKSHTRTYLDSRLMSSVFYRLLTLTVLMSFSSHIQRCEGHRQHEPS